MKRNHTLVALWVVGALACAWIVYGFVDFLRNKDSYLSRLDRNAVLASLREKGAGAKARDGQRKWPAYENLYKLNVTGKPPAVASTTVMGPPGPPVTNVVPVADLLRIPWVLFDEQDPTGTRPYDAENFIGHRCYVLYKNEALAKEGEPFLTIADHLLPPHEAIEVKAIFMDRVVFARPGAEDEEIPVKETEIAEGAAAAIQSEGEAASQPASRPARRLGAVARDWPAETTEIQPNKWRVAQPDLDEMNERATELAGTDLTVHPAYRKGENHPYGLRITAIRSGSVLEGKGLSQGDIVKAINGTAVSSREQVFDYARTHADLRAFTLEIERRGRPYTLQYFLPR